MEVLISKIAYLGPKGTFTEEALRELCAHVLPEKVTQNIEFIPKETIPDCLLTCEQDEVEFSLVPMENSIEGSVNITLDWLIHQVNLPIQAEITLPIAQYALVSPKQKSIELSHIEKIFSHPHAIAQCHSFIREFCPEAQLDYMRSTAEAAERIAAHPEEKWLAIGTKLAAELNQLVAVKERIEDYPNNFTRFVLVGKKPLLNLGYDSDEISGKTSILVTLPEDYPGALHQVLSAFAWRKLNLTRIESRPTKKKLGSYFFFIDIEHIMDNVLVPAAISEIEALGCQVRFLGSYFCFSKELMSKTPTQA